MVSLTVNTAGRFRRLWRNRTTLLTVTVAILAATVFALMAAIVNGRSPSKLQPTVVPGASDTDQSIPIHPFPIQWSIWQSTIPLPDGGAIYGPNNTTGYADTPRSGIVAAIQIRTRAVFSVWPYWQPVLDQQVLPGPGRDLIAAMHRQGNGRLLIPEGGLPRVVGFKVLAYDPSTLVVALAQQRFPDEMPIQVLTHTMRWVDNTWKLEVTPDGSPYTDSYTVANLTGYVPFGLPFGQS